jgi:signal recognition particle subunit SEC65
LSLVLYPIIFARRPQEEARRIAEELFSPSVPGRRSSVRDFTKEELKELIAEIRLELESPTQSVRDIESRRAKRARVLQ